MNNAVTRACAWVSLALLTYAPLAAAQTLETFAGGKRFLDNPALETPVLPYRVVVGFDGRPVVVNRSNDQILRLDVATGRASALPTQTSLQPFANIWDASFGPDGKLYALQLQRLVKLDL